MIRKLSMVLILSFLYSALAIAQFAGGAGSEEDPFLIETVDQLQLIGELEYLSAHFKLVNTIDATETDSWNNGRGFIPIGDFDNNFTGTFDGGGHVISNLTINDDSSDNSNAGLFGYTAGAVLKNIVLEDLFVLGNNHVGGVVGRLIDSELYNSSSTGTVKGSSNIGGLVGT